MLRALVILLAGWCSSGAALAASVTLHPNGQLVVLEGRIEMGDFDKVLRLSREAAPTGIYLASPGGNLGEALRIGSLVRRLAWETKSAEATSVPAGLRAGVAMSYGIKDLRNQQCASACFFIFVSGIYRDGHALGIHQPYMSPAEVNRMSEDEALRKTRNARAVVELFLARMGVPRKYVDAMYEVPKEQIRWLTEEEIAADFHGFIPSVREWVATQCGESAGTVRCKDEVMMGIRLRALQQSERD